MQYRWLDGIVRGEIVTDTKVGGSAPITLQFLNNGALSITVGNDSFMPDEADLKAVFEWAVKVVEAIGIPSDQVVVGAYQGKLVP